MLSWVIHFLNPVPRNLVARWFYHPSRRTAGIVLDFDHRLPHPVAGLLRQVIHAGKDYHQ
jgi:hypothetical protein